MAEANSGYLKTGSISGLGWLAVVLVLVTGVLHIYSGVIEARIPVLLAGVGFLGAITLYLADYRRRLLYLLGIGYTAIQIPIWFVVKAGEYTVIGYVDKAVQIVLILVLAYLYWRSRSGPDERFETMPTEEAG
jgi:hypothetical protein